MSRVDTTAPAPVLRIAPSVPVAVGLFIAHIVVFQGLTLVAGTSFDDRFSTGSNAFRFAVISLPGAHPVPAQPAEQHHPEAWVMLITMVWFCLFHLLSVFGGPDIVGTLTQCFLAGASASCTPLPSHGGLLVLAMLAHGLWGLSLFPPRPRAVH